MWRICEEYECSFLTKITQTGQSQMHLSLYWKLKWKLYSAVVMSVLAIWKTIHDTLSQMSKTGHMACRPRRRRFYTAFYLRETNLNKHFNLLSHEIWNPCQAFRQTFTSDLYTTIFVSKERSRSSEQRHLVNTFKIPFSFFYLVFAKEAKYPRACFRAI